MPHLFTNNPELLLEAVRALGNFSRDAGFRADMQKARGTPMLPQDS